MHSLLVHLGPGHQYLQAGLSSLHHWLWGFPPEQYGSCSCSSSDYWWQWFLQHWMPEYILNNVSWYWNGYYNLTNVSSSKHTYLFESKGPILVFYYVSTYVMKFYCVFTWWNHPVGINNISPGSWSNSIAVVAANRGYFLGLASYASIGLLYLVESSGKPDLFPGITYKRWSCPGGYNWNYRNYAAEDLSKAV